MRAAHDATEDFSASGIVAQEFQKKAGDSVQKKIGPKNLAIELLALEHPHQSKKNRQFSRRFQQLRRFQRLVQRRARPIIRQRIGKRNSPEMMCRFAVAASGGETSYTPDGVTDRQSGSKSVASGERRHVMFPDKPGSGGECADQSSRKNATRLQCADAENFSWMRRVDAPIVDDVEHLGADDSKQDNQNAKIPPVLRIDTLPFGVAYADPHANQNSGRDQQPVRGQTEISDMKESGEHYYLDATLREFVPASLANERRRMQEEVKADPRNRVMGRE